MDLGKAILWFSVALVSSGTVGYIFGFWEAHIKPLAIVGVSRNCRRDHSGSSGPNFPQTTLAPGFTKPTVAGHKSEPTLEWRCHRCCH